MRRITLAITLAMMLGVVLLTLPHKTEGRASAINANSLFAATLSIDDATLIEGDSGTSNMVFHVTLTASGAHSPVTVRYATANGSATAPSDYMSPIDADALGFPAGTGNATMTISVPIIGDTMIEPDETFFVNLRNADGASIADAQGVGTIINDDGVTLPTLSINDVSVTEGNTGTVDAVFTVSLSPSSSSAVTVNFATADSSATVANNEYLAKSGTVTFAPNDTTPKSISIQVVSDTRAEPNETFFVNLSSPVGAAIADGQGLGTIRDDDSDYRCFIWLERLDEHFSAAGGTPEFMVVHAGDTCPWSASSNATWITIRPGTESGTGFGWVEYAVAANTGAARKGTISVSGHTLEIIQDSANGCNYTVPSREYQNIPEAGGTAMVTVETTTPTSGNCEWRPVANVPWITLDDPTTQTGTHTVSYSVPANTTSAYREGKVTIIVGGESLGEVIVYQWATDGCPSSVTPFENSFSPGGGSGSLTVSANNNCNWAAVSEAPWITIVSGGSGAGGGTVDYSVAPNMGIDRDARMIVAGRPVRISQSGSHTCPPTIVPSAQEFSARGGRAVALVQTGPNCTIWGATTSDAWISDFYISDANELEYTVAPNSSASPRTGTILIRTSGFQPTSFVVTQAAVPQPSACVQSVSPETLVVFDEFSSEQGSAIKVVVTAPNDCRWEPIPGAPWIHILGVTSATGENPPRGNGSFTYQKELVTDENRQSFFRNPRTAILVGGKSHSVSWDGRRDPCLLELFCSFFPSALLPGTCPDDTLSGARSFRDNVLAKTPRGQRYTRLYYQLSTEAVPIVMLNPMLVLRSREVMERYMPIVESMAKGEQVTLTEGDIEEIDGFLRSFAEKGGPEFRETLNGLRQDLRDPQVHREFKITVTSGTKGALSGNSGLQPASLMIGPLGLFLFVFYGMKIGRIKTRKQNRKRLLWVAIFFSVVGAQEPVVTGQSSVSRLPWANVPLPSGPGKSNSLPANALRNKDTKLKTVPTRFDIRARSKPLVANSALAFSSYFGGNKNEEGSSIAVDSAGNVYVTGFTDSINFPLFNAAQPTFGGGQQDAFVAKLDPSGTHVLYSTYIGGNGQDNGTSIAVDSGGNAYITGFTDSTNFPALNAFQPTNRGNFNAFVVKLNPAGVIVNSTLFGGTAGDYGSSIAVDSAGNVYMAGLATSPDIPKVNALQSTLGGLVDIYVAKINPSGDALVYSTYLGASGIEGASSIAIDAVGNLYLTGLTSSLNFTTVNALQATHGGGTFDVFVAKLNPSGTQIIYATFLGGGGEDRAFRIAVDSAGSAYVTGDTDSTDFPVLNAWQPIKGGSADAFVAKLNPSGNQLVYSTYLGGSGIEAGTAITADSAGNAYVAGFTASTNFPTANPLEPSFGGGAYDGFVAKLNPTGSSLDYSTYLGGSGVDSVFAIAADSSANAYIMGVTDSTNFPTANAFQGANGGGTADVFIAKLAGVLASRTVQFDRTTYTVSEGDGSTQIMVTRSGDLSVASTAEYVVTDGSALQRTDYTLAAGTINFAVGEGAKSFRVLISDDLYVEGAETINLSLSNPTGGFGLGPESTAVLTIQDNDTGLPSTNPLDDAAMFVRQHYYDFLNRLPDQGGFDYWTQQITQCGNDAQCVRNKRIDVSNAFFYEQEFQETGAYVYRVYKAALGQRPNYAQFMPDRSRVIGGPQLDQSKTDLANLFVQRPAFIAIYPNSMTPAQYVDGLNANTESSLTQAQRDALVSGLTNGTETRGSVLRKVADSSTFIDREYNASFVLTQYFGYLRRDPDPAGFDFWLGQVNRFPLRDVATQHAMVCSFITSGEYQQRFGAIVSHSNQECPQ